MAINLITNKDDEVVLYKGSLESSSDLLNVPNPISGDVYSMNDSGAFYIYTGLEGGWTTLSTNEDLNLLLASQAAQDLKITAIEDSLANYVTQDQVMTIRSALTRTIDENANELSTDERKQVVDAIAAYLQGYEYLTSEEIQEQIEAELAEYGVLTSDQVTAIVMDAINNTVHPLPDVYTKTEIDTMLDELEIGGGISSVYTDGVTIIGDGKEESPLSVKEQDPVYIADRPFIQSKQSEQDGRLDVLEQKTNMSIDNKHVFDTEADANSYFELHPEELTEDLLVVFDSSLWRHTSEGWVKAIEIVQGPMGPKGDDGYPYAPDYANTENINRISLSNLSWVADRDGYVHVFARPSGGGAVVAFNVNDRGFSYVVPTPNTVSSVLQVSKGDVVSLATSTTSGTGSMTFQNVACYYIPPKAVVSNVASAYALVPDYVNQHRVATSPNMNVQDMILAWTADEDCYVFVYCQGKAATASSWTIVDVAIDGQIFYTNDGLSSESVAKNIKSSVVFQLSKGSTITLRVYGTVTPVWTDGQGYINKIPIIKKPLEPISSQIYTDGLTILGDGTENNKLTAVPDDTKVDKYYTDAMITKSMLDLKVGDDLAGSTITFDTDVYSYSVDYYTEIVFENNASIYPSGISGSPAGRWLYQFIGLSGIICSENNWEIDYLQIPNEDGFKIKSISIVRGTDHPEVMETQMITMAGKEEISIEGLSVRMDGHMSTDRFRWSDVYNDVRESIIRTAHAEGLIEDEVNYVEVPATETGMTVNDNNGGLFGVKFANTDSTFTVITVNGEEKYSSEGLTANVPVTKWFLVRREDVISATNAQMFYYTPFKIDPAGAYAQREALRAQIVELTEMILNIRAQLAGKEPDLSNVIDIEAAAQGVGYTVPDTYSELGGRITGAGIKALLANTGRVTVNGKEVYNNTSALGLEIGVDAMQPVDVVSGDLIISSGMDSLFFTPYKQRPIE